MITQELESNIHFARRDAVRRGLATLTVEHLALVLLENSSVQSFLKNSRADVALLRKNLSHFLRAKVPRQSGEEPPAPSEGFQRVLRRAVKHGNAREAVTGMHVVAAIFSEPDSFAAYYMKKSGIERLTVIAHLAEQTPAPADAPSAPGGIPSAPQQKEETDWVTLARNGELEAPFGRQNETSSLIRILARKYKNNALLVGKPGVGKTAVVRALAHRVASGDAPQEMPSLTRIVPVAMGELIAGTKYRGDFELRMRNLLDDCKKRGGAVLFIDEIHTLIGAGAVAGGALDAANIFKPMLEDDALRCVGATTESEFSRVFAKDAALLRRFEKVAVAEPQGAQLTMILEGAKKRLAAHHRLEYAPDAVGETVRLAKRYMPARYFPDKGVDILDDAAARRKLAGGKAIVVNGEDIADAVAESAGLPSSVVREDEKKRLANLESRLRARILEQPEAVSRLAGAVLRARLGYHDGGRTAGAFLFAGPTGVGKTETARQLAKLLALPLLRYDMSEYMEPHAVSKLIGAPPGYIGFEERGRLTEDIAANPSAVVLFDEIDKAHPDVLSVLLQIMDYATLNDSGGRRADFSNALLVMTSNAGAREFQKGGAGFNTGDEDDKTAAAKEALSRLHTPEFRNRLDAIVRFNPLSSNAVSKILTRRLKEIAAELKQTKGVKLTTTTTLRAKLRADGFTPTMGARPLERLLRERVMEPLARKEAEGALPRQCKIDWHNDRAVVK